MLKRKLRYIFESWHHYGMKRQCLFLLISAGLLLVLAVGLNEAQGRGRSYSSMSLDDRMEVLTEKLQWLP